MNKFTLTLIIHLLLFCLPAMAQKVSLNERNSPLKEVLQKIKDQTSLNVFYNNHLIKKTKKVTIKAQERDLISVLNEIFDVQPVSYSIANNTIVVIPKKRHIQESVIEINVIPMTASLQVPMVSGIVRDQHGNPLPGVTVYNPKYDKSESVATDKNGEFQIRVSRGDLLTFSCLGFNETTFLFRGEPRILVSLFTNEVSINAITVEAEVKKKLNLNTQIDLTNRSYMNLGQILQGTVPGLTLQILPSNRKKVIGVTEVTGNQTGGGGLRPQYYPLDQFLKKNFPNGQRIIDALQNGRPVPGGGNFFLEYDNQASVTLVPELRGSATFGNTEGMMVIIDGFPVDEFPADYPMANVESVEVIKDPKELIKWGPRATAGIILIKTNGAKMNKIRISYNTNMYYKPAPEYNIKKLGLASSRDLIDMYRSIADSGYLSGNGDGESLDYVNRIINWYESNKITEEQYNFKMDSLASLSNEGQVKFLQQNAFSQNHMLTVSGGSNQYRFTVTGTYNNSKGNGLGNNSDNFGIDLKNNFRLLQNKLKASWQINANTIKTQGGANEISLHNLPPVYQMMLDNNGNYIYDHHQIGEYNNNLIQKAGYFNHGENLIEDARLQDNQTRTLQAQSRLDMDWEFFKGLKWTNSVFFRMFRINSDLITDRNSTEGRQRLNSYGAPTGNGVDFYIPPGDILRHSITNNLQWNLRSSLGYSRTFGDHTIGINVGGGGASDESERPVFPVVYGYNRATGYGSPIFLPAGDPMGGIDNYRKIFMSSSQMIYPYTLLSPVMGDSTIIRNLNWNVGMDYEFKEKLIVASGSYMEAMSPNPGMKYYAATKSYNGEIGYNFRNEILPDWLAYIRASTGISGNKMPDLPTSIGSSRLLQPDWNNYSIWVNNFIPVQQVGQSSTNIYQRLTFGFFDNQLILSGSFNTQKMRGISESGNLTDSTAFNSTRTIRYFSASAEGNLRDGTLLFNADFNRSPEGQKMINANLSYDIKKESYFTSEFISSLLIGGTIQDISSFQGLGLMMGTNSASGGGFGLATNSNFQVLPPRNRNIEAYFQLGFDNERTRIDLRYYNRSDIGISNNVPQPTDPSTGLTDQYSYSNIVNKGLEFYLKSDLIRKAKTRYTVSVNGAYNVNMAKEVPKTPASNSTNYLTAFRSGYNTSNVWAYRWAGLNEQGAPQIYDLNGNKTATPDSTTLADAIVYMGATRAPWSIGFIHEFNYSNVFARVTFMGNFGGIMRSYIPVISSSYENAGNIVDRWRKPGDEAFTDVPAISKEVDKSIRGYIAQNSSNSFMSANFIRLQEVMIGWNSPRNFFNNKFIQQINFSIHAQNVAVWAKNKRNFDPNTVDNSGRPGLPIPVQYGCSLNVTF